MKKLLNKLSNSGNLKEETQFTGEEHIDTHVRKSTTLPSEPKKDAPEEIKIKKSFSLSKATSPRYQAAMESEDFSKKKSSSNGLKKEKNKDKLNESDDKLVRKSKSEKTVKSPNSLKSPSLKSIFASPYEHQRDAKGVMMDSSSDEEDDAFVPHQHADLRDENNNEYISAPIRVPSAPARMATSPSFSSSSPSPSPSSTLVSLHARAASPSPLPPPSSSPTRRSPTPSSPPSFFTQSPPTHALTPTPHVIVADEFETTFASRTNNFNYDDNNNNTAERFGKPIKFLETESRSDQGHFNMEMNVDEEKETFDPVDGEEVLHQKNKSGGMFYFNSNKPMKLKA